MDEPTGRRPETGAIGIRLELFVDDVEHSVRWYVDGLGFTVDPTAHGSYRPVSCGSARLALQDIDTLDAEHPVVRAGRSAARGIGVEIVVEFATSDDVRAGHDRAAGAGLAPSPLERQPWGLTDFRVLDPDGYYVRVTHVPGSG